MTSERRSKYEVLRAWLQLQRDRDVIEISPKELERRLRKFDEKFSFPPAAYKHAAWWTNEMRKNSHTQARNGWLAAGWRAYPRVRKKKVVSVTFRREATETSAKPEVEKVGKVLSMIPLEAWNRILENEPEMKLGDQLPRYGFGKFATLMVMAALNDYQLKGPADRKYWPIIHKLIKENPVPDSLEDMKKLLSRFYERERFRKAKLKRLNRFLDSPLARKLWVSNPSDVSRNFPEIWMELSKVMKQKKNAKTIVFAMKTLAIALILSGHYDKDSNSRGHSSKETDFKDTQERTHR